MKQYIIINNRTKEIIGRSSYPPISVGNEHECIYDELPERQYDDSYFTYENGQFIEHKNPEPIDNRTYEEKVVDFIRERYSLDAELAIQRQRDTKPEEFAEYFEYCEECKERAKNLL